MRISPRHTSGFTLIETLVAISLLTIAIVAPMTLTNLSLSGAYYARDQITAYNLAQEGIEAVRAIRDGQILAISLSGSAAGLNLFGAMPIDTPFIIDGLDDDPDTAMTSCSGACDPLQLSPGGDLYGYGAGWTNTQFTRTLRASAIEGNPNELRLAVTVSWKSHVGQLRSFTIYENVYRWIQDGSAAE
jgi:prepilin-type N-terminal cleavage/methylation domain-containing protein